MQNYNVSVLFGVFYTTICLKANHYCRWTISKYSVSFSGFSSISTCHIAPWTMNKWKQTLEPNYKSFFLSRTQELIYVSDGPNYSLIHILLAHLQEDLRLYVSPPDGTRKHPATTCLELWLCHPEYSSGQFKSTYSTDVLLNETAFLRSLHWSHYIDNQAVPNVFAGMYYIDPNQGSPADALLVYCNFSTVSKQTCLHPQDSQVTSQKILKSVYSFMFLMFNSVFVC